MLAGRVVVPDADGQIECDLRTLPMRVYAIVPASLPGYPLAETDITTRFGSHLKDMAIQGNLALFNAFNWDSNLYALNLDSGTLAWRRRVGHYFAFAPQAAGDGFTVQSYDFTSAQGYHLHLFDKDGQSSRRFALPGLPQRLPHEFVSGAFFLDRMNQFATSPRGDWIIAAGSLGIAAWDQTGKLLWSKDASQFSITPALIATLSDDALAVARGMSITAINPRTGAELWRQDLSSSGQITRLAPGADGGTLAVLATTESGRVFIVRDGKLASTIPAHGDEITLSPDGSRLAITDVEKLKLYDTAGGLLWQFNGDEPVHHPRFAPDGMRVACSSEQGAAYVLSREGEVLLDRDAGALAVPAWLPTGDLILATWMGTVVRLDREYRETWRVLLSPDPAVSDIRPAALKADVTPTSRYESWTNAQPAGQPEGKGKITAPDGRGVMRPWRQETGLAPRPRSGRLAPEPDAAGRPDETRSGVEMPLDRGLPARRRADPVSIRARV